MLHNLVKVRGAEQLFSGPSGKRGLYR